jgi:hypothetical protein
MEPRERILDYFSTASCAVLGKANKLVLTMAKITNADGTFGRIRSAEVSAP